MVLWNIIIKHVCCGVWLSLARAPGLGPGSRRFESCHPDSFVSDFLKLSQKCQKRKIRLYSILISPISHKYEKSVSVYTAGKIDREIYKFKTVLRLVTSADNTEYKNSVITFMKIDEKEWNRLLRNKRILYKKE